ncbi:CYTH domain-containing protein [Microbacterium horticulturae]|uniref:CYTH domain-containing protein n=1 Tax=Microbacterium horticulturae TaxID=3028316 RepID=A0ABY8C145_9MICO|nr:CYTH domain-containing protein [Microbacterium sp. KACC 23027]WEG10133.1 CYTH domain-containing protein [Microbacterium sp. KACC 23027]
MSADANHSLEVERKYDVDEAAQLPDWTALRLVTRVDAAEHRALDARYLDTADLALSAARVAVRRREGGPDAGWHIKASAPEGKHEWHWPLGADSNEDVPVEVAAALARWSTGPFLPLARIRNERVAYALRDDAGGLVAEVVDDHVRAVDERSGASSSWREWEVELGPAAPADPAAFFTAVDALVTAAGGRVAASDSKLARAVSASGSPD